MNFLILDTEKDVSMIIDSGVNVNVLDKNLKWTPLHYAADTGKIVLLKVWIL